MKRHGLSGNIVRSEQPGKGGEHVKEYRLESFVARYRELCEKHGLYVDVDVYGNYVINEVSGGVFEAQMRDLVEAKRRT